MLMLFGPAAATVAAAVEGFVGAFRTSKRWTSRLGTPAIAALCYGKVPLAALEEQGALTVSGAREALQQFADLFEMPPKAG